MKRRQMFGGVLGIVLTVALGAIVTADSGPAKRQEWPATFTERVALGAFNRDADALSKQMKQLQDGWATCLADASARLGLKPGAGERVAFDVEHGVFYIEHDAAPPSVAPIATATK